MGMGKEGVWTLRVKKRVQACGELRGGEK